MTFELTEEEKAMILAARKEKEGNPAPPADPTPPQPPKNQGRDTKGRFQPKPPAQTPPEPAPEPPQPEDDSLLKEIEADLLKKLNNKIDPKNFEEFDLRTRIKIFRTLDKENTANKPDAHDPTQQAPPTHEEPKTLSELNNMVDFLHDVQKSNSMFNITNKIRGKT